METRWVKLVEQASSAPSPHNTQPWRLRVVSEKEADLIVPIERTLPWTDRDGAFMTCSIGIFVEALDLAAAADGLALEAECFFPDLGAGAAVSAVFARLRLAPRTDQPAYAVDLLARRQTARGAYDGRPAAADALTAAEAVARGGGHELRFTSEREVVDWTVGLNADTVFFDLDDDKIRKEIGIWVHRSNADARRTRDGFSPSCLGFPAPLVNLFFFHHRLFASQAVRAAARRFFLWKTRGTSTVGWLAGPWRTPEDRFEAGRMLLRLWLELTRHGLYVQPFGSVVTNPRSHALMAERFSVDETGGEVWLLLRVGYCSPPPRSLRRPVAEIVT